MKIFSFVLKTMLLIVFIPLAKASSTDLINTKQLEGLATVVYPGTRLAAGNLSQNEFYILEKSETHKVTTTRPIKAAPKANVAKIQLTIHESLRSTKKPLNPNKKHLSHTKNYKLKHRSIVSIK